MQHLANQADKVLLGVSFVGQSQGLARSVEDVALVLNAVAGPDPRDPACADAPVPDFAAGLDRGVAGLRLGLLRAPQMERAEPEVREAVTRAARTLQSAGAELMEVEAPLLAEADTISLLLMGPEPAAYHLDRLKALYTSRRRGGVE